MALEDVVVGEIYPRLFSLTFPKRRQQNTTLVRISEHFESPHFKGKVFTRKEFQAWYTTHSLNGKRTGKYTYNSDFEGFNFPGRTLEPFYNGDFDPLSRNERAVLGFFERERETKFYVISRYIEGNELMVDSLRHELAHGLFYLNDDYRHQATAIVETLPRSVRLRTNKRLKILGYCQEVLLDETQAYLLTVPLENWPFRRDAIQKAQEAMTLLFDSHFKTSPASPTLG